MRQTALPARGFTSPKRLSRALFEWDARDLSATARSGQAGTFARASIGMALGSDLRYRTVGYSAPRWAGVDLDGDGQIDAIGLLMEPTTTNLVKQNCALATTPWVSGTAPTNAVATAAGIALSRINSANASATHQPMTLTGNTPKGITAFLKTDGVTGTYIFGLSDDTAGVFRYKVTATVNADGSITAVANNGILLGPAVRLADGLYAIVGQSTAVTATNTHTFYANDGSALGGTATSILAGGFQVEDAPCPSSLIITGATVGVREADQITWPALCLPQTLSPYVRYVDLGGVALAGQTQRLFRISSSASSIADLLIDTTAHAQFEAGGVDADSVVSVNLGALPAVGSLVELAGTWQADATTPANQAAISVSARVNGGLIQSGITTGSRLPASWTDATIELNSLSGDRWPHVFLSARIDAGLRSLDQLAAR